MLLISISILNRFEVVRDNWYNLLDPEIAEDLRSRRTYNETKVSGLLRALRNKKHHYQVILHYLTSNIKLQGLKINLVEVFTIYN